jgi:hypothetical protein
MKEGKVLYTIDSHENLYDGHGVLIGKTSKEFLEYIRKEVDERNARNDNLYDIIKKVVVA